MKKFVAILSILLLFALLTACSGGGIGNAVDNFLREIDEGNYAEAADIYFDKIWGNTEREREASRSLKDRLDDAIEDFNTGEKSFDEASDVITTIERTDVLSAEDTDDAVEALDQLDASKAAYDSAENLYNDGFYYDAYTSYMNVMERDTLYGDAQAKAQQAIEALLDDLDGQLEELVADDDYAGALELIDATTALIGDTTELATKRTDYTARYLNAALDQAEDALTSEGYEQSIRIITTAIGQIGEDPRLTAALEEYQSYIPVYLYDLEYFDTDSDATSSFAWQGVGNSSDKTDNFGNNYKYALHVDCQDGFSSAGSWASVRYHLGGKYSVFSGTCITPYDDRDEDVSGYLEIYGDDVLLYQSPTMVSDSAPEPFSVDVSGVEFLEIVFTPPSVFRSTPTLCDGMLTKEIG